MSAIIRQNQIAYLDSIQRTQDELTIEMENFARENNIPILDRYAVSLLEILIKIHKPKRALEIGMAIAYSTIRIAKCLDKKCTITAIEKSKDNINLAKNFIDRSGQAEKINILEGDALYLLPALSKKYDFIFLDADKEDYERLFDYSLKLLKKDGIIFIDNLLWHGLLPVKKVPAKYKTSTAQIKNFNNIFMNSDTLMTQIFTVGDGVGIGIKTKKKKSKPDENKEDYLVL